MTAKRHSLLILMVFADFLALLVYTGGRHPAPSVAQECARRCHPKTGALERTRPQLGPAWRADAEGLVCVCR
jgi:hypothetical protein